jgi:hypothetical protein
MKNRLLVVISILVLILPILACSESQPQAAANPFVTQTAMAQAIAGLQAQISAKPDRTELTTLQTQINAAGAGNSYTKAETEQKIKDAIQVLKDDTNAPWQKKGTATANPSTPNNPIPNLGSNNWQYGTYQLFNVSGGQATNYIFFGGSMQTWQLLVTNTSAGPLYIAPQVLFTTTQSSPYIYWNNTSTGTVTTCSGQCINDIKISPNGWANSLYLNISPTCTWKSGDAAPAASAFTGAVATNTLTVMPTCGGTNAGGIFVGSGQTQTWYITMNINTANGNSGPWSINVTPIGWWNQ